MSKTDSQVRLFLKAHSFQGEPLVSEETSVCLLCFALVPRNLQAALNILLGLAFKCKVCPGLQNQLTACSFLPCRKPPLALSHLTAFICSGSRPCVAMTWGVTSARPCSSKVSSCPFCLPCIPRVPSPLGFVFFPVQVLGHKNTNLA